MHGDIIATTDPTGTITGSGDLYDPYGQPIDATSGTLNLAATPTTRTNGLTDAWEGQSQRAYEHTGGLNETLMGARLYLPAWGQFVAIDPVPGGNANPYMYPADPINGQDLTGNCAMGTQGAGKGHCLPSGGDFISNHWRGILQVAGFAACIVVTAAECAIAAVVIAVATNVNSDGSINKTDMAIDIAAAFPAFKLGKLSEDALKAAYSKGASSAAKYINNATITAIVTSTAYTAKTVTASLAEESDRKIASMNKRGL
jgi:RHS repeat-associated protein